MVTFEADARPGGLPRRPHGVQRSAPAGLPADRPADHPAAVGYIALPTGLDSRTFEPSGVVGLALGLAGIIAAFSIGLPGFSTYLFALRGFYAKKNTGPRSSSTAPRTPSTSCSPSLLVRSVASSGLALAFAARLLRRGGRRRRSCSTAHSPGFDWRALVRPVAAPVAAAVMGGCVFGVGLASVVGVGRPCCCSPSPWRRWSASRSTAPPITLLRVPGAEPALDGCDVASRACAGVVPRLRDACRRVRALASPRRPS